MPNNEPTMFLAEYAARNIELSEKAKKATTKAETKELKREWFRLKKLPKK
jgi:hypothetical protein